MNYKFEMKKKVEEYLSILQELEGKVSDSSTAIAVLQEIAKDRRSEQINGQKSNGSRATLKQKTLLDKLNVVYDEEISKAEASRLLDQALQKDQKE